MFIIIRVHRYGACRRRRRRHRRLNVSLLLSEVNGYPRIRKASHDDGLTHDGHIGPRHVHTHTVRSKHSRRRRVCCTQNRDNNDDDDDTVLPACVCVQV